MFNFLELEKEDVKKLIKVVGEKDFKRAPQKILPDKRVVLKALKKEINRVEFPKLRAYVEGHLDKMDDGIVVFYCKLLGVKLAKDYPFMDELHDVIGNSPFGELTDEQKANIAKHKEAYDANPVLDEYDNFIKFLCVPSKETIEKVVESKNEEILKGLQDEIEKIKTDYNRLVTDYNDQLKKTKVSNNEIERLKKANENLEKSMSFENVSFNLKQLLPAGFTATSMSEIYNELTKVEQVAMTTNNYELCNKALAAKFAVAKLMKEGKK